MSKEFFNRKIILCSQFKRVNHWQLFFFHSLSSFRSGIKYNEIYYFAINYFLSTTFFSFYAIFHNFSFIKKNSTRKNCWHAKLMNFCSIFSSFRKIWNWNSCKTKINKFSTFVSFQVSEKIVEEYKKGKNGQ